MIDSARSLIDAIAALLAQPAAIPFLISFGLGFVTYQVRSRRKILLIKSVRDASFAVYYYMTGAMVGAYAVLIATVAGLTQLATPDHKMQQTHVWRLILAIVFAAIGVLLMAKQTTDWLPLAAVVIMRFVETLADPQKIRMGIVVPSILWIIYSVDNALYLVLIAQSVALLSLLAALYRHRAR